DAYVGEAVQHHTGVFQAQQRLVTLFAFLLTCLNALLIVATAAFAIVLNLEGQVSIGTVAMALPLTWQIVSISGWVAYQVTATFENIGVVQEGMATIARPLELPDAPDAEALAVTAGAIDFKDVSFAYNQERGIIKDLTLRVKPGEKIGLVGPSGAGKS